jgi:hypothetical protein
MLRAIEAEKAAMRDDKISIMEGMVKAESPTFGATGKFPMGKIDKTDEGEIAFGITSHRGKVIINFGKPVAWLGMDAAQASMLAVTLIRHANRCRDIGDQQETQAKAKEHAS